MAVIVSLFRAVNVGGRNRIKMDALRDLCTTLKFRDVRTYVQSGNVVFSTREQDMKRLVKQIENAVEKTFGFRSDAILRTTADLRGVVARNPFAKRDCNPSRLLVTFLAGDPAVGAAEQIRKIPADPEELVLDGRELYIYYPEGMGRSRLSATAIGKALQTPGTARNWNTVVKLLEMAEELEAASK